MRMNKTLLVGILCCPLCLWAQETATPDVNSLTKQEEQAVASILAQNAAADTAVVPAAQDASPAKEDSQEPAEEPVEEEEEEKDASAPAQCLTVAFIDIDQAFNAHPRTVAVKEQIHRKILAKEEEVDGARQLIETLSNENAQLAAQLRTLKPFYQRIVVEPQPLLPKIEETADSLEVINLLNRLTFAEVEIIAASPLNTPAQLEDITARIAANKKIIAEREFFIDNYKYTTREEILKLEQQEVAEILQDIYKEIKSFAKKRNIGAVVRKDEVLYGQKPVNVTKDFINRLKKSKKYRKRGK